MTSMEMELRFKSISSVLTGTVLIVLTGALMVGVAVRIYPLVGDSAFIFRKTDDWNSRGILVIVALFCIFVVSGILLLLIRIFLLGVTIIRLAGGRIVISAKGCFIERNGRIKYYFSLIGLRVSQRSHLLGIKLSGRRFYDVFPYWIFHREEYQAFTANLSELQ